MSNKLDFQESIFRNFSSEKIAPEEIMKKPPTSEHLIDVQQILKDFGIKKNVYKETFSSVCELQRWLHSAIVEYLHE